MAVTITSGILNAFEGESSRAIAATADGTLWACVWSDTITDRWEFWYSTDDGATWTENVSLRINSPSPANAEFAFAINAVNDIAVFRYDGGNVRSIYGLTTSSTAWVDGGSPSDIASSLFCDMVVFDKPGSSNFFVATVYDNVITDILNTMEFTSAGAYVGDVDYSLSSVDGSASLDFNHTGDGNTVAGSAPHLYVSYLNTSQYPTCGKYTYSSGLWTAGTQRTLYAGATTNVLSSCVFDGERAIMAFVHGNDVRVFERDAADTTTTDRTAAVPAMPGSAVSGVRVSANGTTGFDLYTLDATDDDIDYVMFTRAGASWGSWTEFANYASGLTAAGWSVSKHKVGSFTPSVWLRDATGFANYDLDAANRTFGTQLVAAGTSLADAFYAGTSAVDAIYLGTDLVYS